MRLGRTLGLAGIACAAAVVAGAALADIAGFNAAVKAGDYKTAAVEAKSAWAAWDRSDPDTALIAREFGFVSYMAGDYAAARDFGEFLRNEGARLTKPDDQPATSGVLLAAANFRLGANDGTRKALRDAVKAREAAPGLDTMSLLAAEALYKSDWGAGRWSEASDSGLTAYNIIARGGEVLAPRALEARASGAAAGFLAGADQKDYERIMDTHDAIVVAIDGAKDPRRRETLVNLSFNMRAWGLATFQYFDSAEQVRSNIPIKVKWRDFTHPQYSYFQTASPPAGDYCKVDINERAIIYPQSNAFRGIIGAVIVKMDVAEDGKVTAIDPLAAVPAQHFVEAVVDAQPRLKVSKTGGPPGCVVARKDWIMSFTFRIL